MEMAIARTQIWLIVTGVQRHNVQPFPVQYQAIMQPKTNAQGLIAFLKWQNKMRVS